MAISYIMILTLRAIDDIKIAVELLNLTKKSISTITYAEIAFFSIKNVICYINSINYTT